LPLEKNIGSIFQIFNLFGKIFHNLGEFVENDDFSSEKDMIGL